MGLVCSICGKEACFVVNIDLGRFDHRFYYCEIHKPLEFKLSPLDDKQADTKEPIREEKFLVI